MSRARLLPCAAVAAALTLAGPAAAEPPSRGRDEGGSRILVPESSLQLLLRNRDALGLDGGQVLTLQLKDAELQRRTQALLSDFAARPERRGPAALDDRGGPRGGGMGPPTGGMPQPSGGDRAERGSGGAGAERRGEGAAPPADDERTRRVLDDVEAMDRAAVEGVRRIFNEAQRPKVEALLARRSERLSRSRPAPASATEPPPRGVDAGSPPPARP